MKTGDYVLIVEGLDDISDGQLCKVISYDETSSYHKYRPMDLICILCWTGYLAWTTQDNVIPIAAASKELEKLFEIGKARTGLANISF